MSTEWGREEGIGRGWGVSTELGREEGDREGVGE